jgi:hypothetical protein
MTGVGSPGSGLSDPYFHHCEEAPTNAVDEDAAKTQPCFENGCFHCESGVTTPAGGDRPKPAAAAWSSSEEQARAGTESENLPIGCRYLRSEQKKVRHEPGLGRECQAR